jgi:NAD(P)-dependent dehydrogenase (short-subunit alcohol dehydrogenase family)
MSRSSSGVTRSTSNSRERSKVVVPRSEEKKTPSSSCEPRGSPPRRSMMRSTLRSKPRSGSSSRGSAGSVMTAVLLVAKSSACPTFSPGCLHWPPRRAAIHGSMPTVLITGASDGLGHALAARLASEGSTVLVHARNVERGRDAVAGLPSDRARLVTGDLASLREVRGLAEQVRSATDRLDVLVNNAGIGTAIPGGGRRMESADGYELRFAVNYLAGFLLTSQLRDRLAAAAPARIVNVASAGQMPIDFDDVMLEDGYSGVRAYCQSKLAQVMHAFDLAEELRGEGITATALHPATYMPTKMVTGAGVDPVSTLEDGVEATWRLAADPALEGVTGEYFNGTRAARAEAQAYDPDARRRLRELAERLTGGVAIGHPR